jgi:flavin reductase (DIM6/NTAB) family NADH-FMN oxidoreductase RutF
MDAIPGPSLREALRGFVSTYFTGASVITSVDGEGRPHGLTCNSLTSITLSPPTLLVSLGNGTGTPEAVLTRRAFAVNLLHDGGRRAAEIFSSPEPGRFTQVAWRRSAHTGLPLLVEDAYATAECELAMTTVVGDHVVVFGSVTACHLCGSLMRRWRQPPVLGEILGRLLLGPSALGLLWPEAGQWLFTPAVKTDLNIAAQLGLVVFMLLLGCELRAGETAAGGSSARPRWAEWGCRSCSAPASRCPLSRCSWGPAPRTPTT